ncbi:MAG: LysE family translocator [Acidiferrobacterales bacterium]
MTIGTIVELFAVMIIGAVIPGVSVMVVSTRSAAYGFIHGVSTTMGIVVGDILFILLAIFGLSILAETMGSLFVWVKYIGGAYLVWLGIALWRSSSKVAETEGAVESSLLSSFLAGLTITLGDQKAILFYFGFLPAFVNLSRISYIDASIIMTIAIVSIVGVKLGYAFMANSASQLFRNSRVIERINIAAGTVMIGIGVLVVTKA